LANDCSLAFGQNLRLSQNREMGKPTMSGSE
jgi:hypothetical protein